jgi:hypothetical protein
LSKKPRILDEYLVGTASVAAAEASTNGLLNLDSGQVQQQEQSQLETTQAGVQKLQKKLTARKSTAFCTSNSQENRLSINSITNLGLSQQSQQQQQQQQHNHMSNTITHNKSISNNTIVLASSTPVNRVSGSSISIMNTKTLPTTTPANTSTTQTQTATTTTTTTMTTAATTTAASINMNGKQFKHKQINCKPVCESKATECVPFTCDASTQLDLDEIKLNHTVVPVPVPVNVPVPMCMYQAPMPIPLLVPVPIPVPVFIPTTKRTYERVERRIKVRRLLYY